MNDNQMSIEADIGGKKSTTTKNIQGVFQGSMLGPLLFILYVNCIVVLEDKDAKLTVYADDNLMNIGCWSKSQASHDTLPTSQMKKW